MGRGFYGTCGGRGPPRLDVGVSGAPPNSHTHTAPPASPHGNTLHSASNAPAHALSGGVP